MSYPMASGKTNSGIMAVWVSLSTLKVLRRFIFLFSCSVFRTVTVATELMISELSSKAVVLNVEGLEVYKSKFKHFVAPPLVCFVFRDKIN